DTTNLWLDMIAISRVVESGPLEKLKSPTLKNFDGAIGLIVPETRYLPVESTSDLLLFQSNLFTCSEGILTRNRTRANSSLPSI
ncbi:UTP--glucose-1-phosphate uridylyltransferase, partial [Mycobacterium kansasii]